MDRVRSNRTPRRLAGLVLALLPGLLLSGGERVRVCLHAWLGLEEACVGMESAEASGCCAAAQEGLRISSEGPCANCCVELAVPVTERVTTVASKTFEAPSPAMLPLRPAPPVAQLARRLLHPGVPAWAPPAPPGRAPIPLRI